MKNSSKVIYTSIVFLFVLSVSNLNLTQNQLISIGTEQSENPLSLPPIRPEGSSFWDLTGTPIVIDNNWSLTALTYAWCTGDGSWNTPYLIENVTLDLTGVTYSGITIQNSVNDYFRIRNCTIFGALQLSATTEAAIKLEYCENGTIINNTLTTNRWQVSLVYGENHTIINNTLSNGNMGVRLQTSHNNKIINNTINQNTYGIYNLQSDIILIENNTLNNNGIHGLQMGSANTVNISGNAFTGQGITIDGLLTDLSSYIIPTTNTLNGKPIYYFVNNNYLKMDNYSNAGQIILVNCHHSEFTQLILTGMAHALLFQYCSNNSVFNNTFSNVNNLQGLLYFDNSDKNNIYNNTMINCRNSIYMLGNSRYNEIHNNTIINSPGAGIYMSGCEDNIIYKNILDNNMRGIYLISNSENITIFENTIINNNYGIDIQTNNHSIENNTIDHNMYGLYLHNCLNNTVYNNIISNHTQKAVRLENSNRTIFTYNKIEDNLDIGVFVQASDNKFYRNEFRNNKIHAIDNGTNNLWDNGEYGNYWDNYTGKDKNDNGIGDDPYQIPGSAGSVDNYPIWSDGDEQSDNGPGDEPDGDFLIIIVVLIIIAGIAIPIVIYSYKNPEKVKQGFNKLKDKIKDLKAER